MSKLKIAYFGTPGFSANLLRSLVDADLPVEIVLVVTQADRPVGREHRPAPAPVKQLANELHLPCYDQPSLTDLEKLILKKRVDLGLLFAWGRLVPPRLLAAPRIKLTKRSGFINVHPSLLPRFRGASPIAFPILLGEQTSGVSLIVMDSELDHGPIIGQEAQELPPAELNTETQTRLTTLAAAMLPKVITTLAGGTPLPLTPQNHQQASYTRALSRQDGFVKLSVLQKARQNQPLTHDEYPEVIKWYYARHPAAAARPGPASAVVVNNLYRALYPWPGLWTKVNLHGREKRLKITRLDLSATQLQISRVQLEGKKEVDFSTFNQAYPFFFKT